MNIYIAGPFSHDNERQALLKMISLVKKRFYYDAIEHMYVPMEYKVPGDFQKLDGTWNLKNHIWAERVFKADLEHLDQANVVFALYTGHYCSSGSIWEIGYARGKGIPVVAYIPDWVKGDMSLMVMNGFTGQIREDGTITSFTASDFKKYNLR